MVDRKPIECDFGDQITLDGYYTCSRCGIRVKCLEHPSRILGCVCSAVPQPKRQSIATKGPGTEFKKLAIELGLKAPCSGCADLMRDMDRWGVEGCRQRRVEIIERLKENAKKLGWGDWLNATTKAALAGYKSFGDLVDEAIRRDQFKSSSQSDELGSGGAE